MPGRRIHLVRHLPTEGAPGTWLDRHGLQAWFDAEGGRGIVAGSRPSGELVRAAGESRHLVLSPLGRAQATADAVLGALGSGERPEVITDPDLVEIPLPTLPLPGAEPAEPSPAAPSEPSVDPAEVERALAMAADLGTRLDAVTKQLADLDARLTSVSRELANQLSELGGDIDALANRPDGATVDEEVLEELRDAQLRLANEQARYQIAFRSDLARLAEQVRRPASR